MSFHDVLFPVEISQGTSGGPGFKTVTTALDSGQEGRVAFWSAPRHKYDVAYGIRNLEDLNAVKVFFMARQGALNTFRFKDFTDFHTSNINPTHVSSYGTRDQQTSPTTGNGTLTTFQLVKRYVSGAVTHVRTVTLPVSGTINMWVNGVLKTSGVDYNINHITGVVTFTAPVTNGHAVEWSGEFHVKCRFGDAADEALAASLDGWDLGGIGQIPIIECHDSDAPFINEYFFGGTTERALSASITLDGSAHLWILSNTTTGLSAILPNPANYAAGGIHFTIVNTGINNLLVKNNLDTTLVTLVPNKSTMIVLTVESDQVTKQWYAIGD